MRNYFATAAVALFLVFVSTGCMATAGGGVRVDPTLPTGFSGLVSSPGVPAHGGFVPGAVQPPPPLMPPGVASSDLFIGAAPPGTSTRNPLVKRVHVENPGGYMAVAFNGVFPEIRAGNGMALPRQPVTLNGTVRQVALLSGSEDLYVLARPGTYSVTMYCVDPTIGEFGWTQKRLDVPDIGLGINLWWTDCQSSAMRPR